ncbi:protein FAM234B-like isoform X2 [Myxocyprinus asiaticus]|uniref:protein FAM234B-like isoform X2 n=1 Tax=Myxocyprinus asiaticus TaxID=70543 RepID=UPI0022224B8F|nr:protein FAM234B-like isoform X2 [Myxocyprinus asiaticus]
MSFIGKKCSDLGEYDPLTQADSEDETEDDDLVLNYPHNGLSPAVPELRGRVRDEEEFDEADDELRVQREGAGHETGGAGLGRGQAGDSEEKVMRVRGVVRNAVFLLPLTCAAVLVLLCAFLIPCPQGMLHNSLQWEAELGDVGGVTSPPVALWDVDGDGLDDVLIGVMNIANNSQPMSSQSKEYSVLAVSGISGHVLWRRMLREPLISLQCGLQTGSADPHNRKQSLETSACILISSSHIISINASTGRTSWTAAVSDVKSHAVLLPDLQGDAFPELLIATLPADQVSDLALILISGRSGALIGQPVNFNLTAQGKLIGPLLHETATGAYYILFGLGTVEGVSLSYIYSQATGRTAASRVRLKDPDWERLRKINTSLIHISSGSEQVEFLFPLVAGLCHNHNNLDSMSVLNTSHSDWILVCGVNNTLSVLKQSDTHAAWTLSLTSMHSRPVSGHFNDDGVPDLLIHQSANGIRKVQIIDGALGRSLWEAEFVCPRLAVEDSSVLTTSGQSVFLFWAGDPLTQLQNVTKVAAAEPVLRKLFLLHPYYPIILLQLSSTTDTILTATVSYQPLQKDASYISVSSRPTSGLGLGDQLLKSFSMKAAIAVSQIVPLGDASRDAGTFHINKFFRRMTFKQ